MGLKEHLGALQAACELGPRGAAHLRAADGAARRLGGARPWAQLRGLGNVLRAAVWGKSVHLHTDRCEGFPANAGILRDSNASDCVSAAEAKVTLAGFSSCHGTKLCNKFMKLKLFAIHVLFANQE